LIGDHNVSTLFHLRNQKNVIAPNGQNGQTKMATGKSGKTVYLPIPLGTVVYFVNATEPIVEILTSGQTHTICHGGKGGHGNAFFKSSFNKAPTLHENGDIGESCHVILKLKYIADVGIIGLPNAGKSTLIGQISNAKPKVANYQFTTLVPVLGKVKIGHNELVFADIPGLIAGAAHGKGLGHEFLKHIERCHVLIHLISLNTTDHDNIIDAYKTILDELQQYNPILAQKATIIVANKNDLPNATTNLEILNDYLKQEVLSISAVKGNNINKLLEQVRLTYENVKKHLDQQAPSPSHITIELKQQKDYTKDLVIKQIADHT
jgi:GTP-binding protein